MRHAGRLRRLERARSEPKRTEIWIYYEGDSEATGPGGERRPVAELPPDAQRIVIKWEDKD